MVNLVFDRLSNDISHFVLAQNFIISTCLRYVDISDFVNFLENGIRDRVEVFSVTLIFKGLSNGISHLVVAEILQSLMFKVCGHYLLCQFSRRW